MSSNAYSFLQPYTMHRDFRKSLTSQRKLRRKIKTQSWLGDNDTEEVARIEEAKSTEVIVRSDIGV